MRVIRACIAVMLLLAGQAAAAESIQQVLQRYTDIHNDSAEQKNEMHSLLQTLDPDGDRTVELLQRSIKGDTAQLNQAITDLNNADYQLRTKAARIILMSDPEQADIIMKASKGIKPETAFQIGRIRAEFKAHPYRHRSRIINNRNNLLWYLASIEDDRFFDFADHLFEAQVTEEQLFLLDLAQTFKPASKSAFIRKAVVQARGRARYAAVTSLAECQSGEQDRVIIKQLIHQKDAPVLLRAYAFIVFAGNIELPVDSPQSDLYRNLLSDDRHAGQGSAASIAITVQAADGSRHQGALQHINLHNGLTYVQSDSVRTLRLDQIAVIQMQPIRRRMNRDYQTRIILTDGSILSGTVLAMQKDTIEFNSILLRRKIALPLNAIAVIQFNTEGKPVIEPPAAEQIQEPHLFLQNGSLLKGEVTWRPNGLVAVKIGSTRIFSDDSQQSSNYILLDSADIDRIEFPAAAVEPDPAPCTFKAMNSDCLTGYIRYAAGDNLHIYTARFGNTAIDLHRLQSIAIDNGSQFHNSGWAAVYPRNNQVIIHTGQKKTVIDNLNQPVYIQPGMDGRFIIAEEGGLIKAFDADGILYSIITGPDNISAIALTRQGTILACRNKRDEGIVEINSQGGIIRTWTGIPYPTALVQMPDKSIIVISERYNRIARLDYKGTQNVHEHISTPQSLQLLPDGRLLIGMRSGIVFIKDLRNERLEPAESDVWERPSVYRSETNGTFVYDRRRIYHLDYNQEIFRSYPVADNPEKVIFF